MVRNSQKTPSAGVLRPLVCDAKHRKKPASLDAATIKQQNDSVNKQLCDKNLHSTDVVGNGNCLFRVISQYVHSSQSKHSELCINIVHHLLSECDIIFDTDSLSPADLSTLPTQSLLMDGQWASEECIKAAADFLKIDIHLYVFVAKISLVVHSQTTGSARHQPIVLVFMSQITSAASRRRAECH